MNFVLHIAMFYLFVTSLPATIIFLRMKPEWAWRTGAIMAGSGFYLLAY